MAQLDDLEFRITASMGDLTTALDRGSSQINQFTNRTAAGFTRLDNRFTQVAGKLRGIFSLFGVGFGVRAFSGWIKDAIEVEKLTAAQAESIGAASKAMQGLQKEFGNLARTAATELAPALETAAKWWKEFLFPSGSQFGSAADALRPQVDNAIAEVERLQLLTANQVRWNAEAGWFDKMIFGDVDPAEATQSLAAARLELERLGEAFRTAMAAGEPPEQSFEQFLGQIQFEEEMRRLASEAAGQPLSRELQVFVGNLEKAEALERSMRTEVEKQVEAWQEASNLFAAGVLPAETLRRLDEEQLQMFDLNEIRAKYKAPLKEIEDESVKTAQRIGDSFQHAFSDWILGAERSFSDLLKRMAVDMATSAIFKGIASLFPGGSFFASFFGGSRATGGDVSAGKMYRVHEGEGFFSPGMNGRVAAVGAGGGVTIVNNIDARGADPSVAARLPAILAENNQRVKAEIRHELGRRR